MTTKEDCIQKYRACKKSLNGAIPNSEAFIKFSGISARKLTALFGRNAYAKLQTECGDEANKFFLERTPRETIMRRYGDLALETLGQENDLPNSADWTHRRLQPTVDALRIPPHEIKWSEFPQVFRKWIESEHIKGYEKVFDHICRTIAKPDTKVEKVDREFDKVVREIRSWSPARRRNSEGEYKVELRSHLKSLGYFTNEEYGESSQDLLIEKKYAVEIKKDPKLGDYDRCFGQLARHLQH